MAKVVAVIMKERRRDQRRKVMFDGEVNDGKVTVIDISAGGVGATLLSEPGPHAIGDDGYEIEIVPLSDGEGGRRHFTVGGEARLKLFQDGEEVLSVLVEVVRFDREEDRLGARFLNISDSQYRVIERLVTGRPVKSPTR